MVSNCKFTTAINSPIDCFIIKLQHMVALDIVGSIIYDIVCREVCRVESELVTYTAQVRARTRLTLQEVLAAAVSHVMCGVGHINSTTDREYLHIISSLLLVYVNI